MGAYLTLATLRQELSEKIGDWRNGTTTGAGSTTTAVDSNLASLNYLPTDFFKNYWILLTSGTYSGSVRPISGFTTSTGTITWQNALAGASGDAVTYEIHRIDPRWKLAALNMARRRASKYLFRPIVDAGNVTGSIIFNGGFVHWTSSTVPLGWRNSGATLSRVSAHLTGSAVQLTGAQSIIDTYTTPYAPIRLSVTDLSAASNLSLYADVYSATASLARIGFQYGSKRSDYHTGGSTWEQLKIEDYSLPAGQPDLLLQLRIESNAAAQFTNVYTQQPGGAQIYQYAVPNTYIGSPTQICVARTSELTRLGGAGLAYDPVTNWKFFEDALTPDEAEAVTTTGIVQFEGSLPPDGYRMQWFGKGLLSSVSADTDKMEVDDNTSPYLYAWAKHLLGLRLASAPAPEEVRQRYAGLADEGWDEKEVMEATWQHLSTPVPVGPPPVRFG